MKIHLIPKKLKMVTKTVSIVKKDHKEIAKHCKRTDNRHILKMVAKCTVSIMDGGALEVGHCNDYVTSDSPVSFITSNNNIINSTQYKAKSLIIQRAKQGDETRILLGKQKKRKSKRKVKASL